MKRISKAVVITAALLLLTANIFAIENLRVSVQCSNVVLSWPSAAGESYIVQYRPSLDPATNWVTLTNGLAASTGVNATSFVHSNIVQHPNCDGGNNLLSSIQMQSMAYNSGGPQGIASAGPMVLPASGLGTPLPLMLYPPGFDLSGLLIFDPVSGETVNGAGYSMATPSRVLAPAYSQIDFPGTNDITGGTSTNGPTPPEIGFYRVVRDGVYIPNSNLAILTNGIKSDFVTVSFEAGNIANNVTGTNDSSKLDNAVIILDDGQFAGSNPLLAPTNCPWEFSMDTAFLENGNHTLQVQATWLDLSATDGQPYKTLTSSPITITVSNSISYPHWEAEIGEMDISAYFFQTTATNADWQIDIIDSQSNTVGSLTGHTTNGIIEAFWNMADANGVLRTNTDADPIFDAIIQVGCLSAKKAPSKTQRRKSFPPQGAWVVAYQDMYKADYSQYGDMEAAIDSFAWLAYSHGGVYLYAPPSGATNVFWQTYPIRYQDPRRPDTNVTSTMETDDFDLMGYFLSQTNSRNFYYSGHGSGTHIATLPGSRFNSLCSLNHRYRFVFLDSCNSANGRLDRVFGINGPERFSLSYYHDTGIRPAAFCGYSKVVQYSYTQRTEHNGKVYDKVIPPEVPAFITNFLFYWELQNYTLSQAFSAAKEALPYVDRFLIQPGANLVIHGYDDLRVDECNQKSDVW